MAQSICHITKTCLFKYTETFKLYSCKPQFYYIKVGFKGFKLYRHVFVMISRQLENRQLKIGSSKIFDARLSGLVTVHSIQSIHDAPCGRFFHRLRTVHVLLMAKIGLFYHITKTRLFKYTGNFTTKKNEKFTTRTDSGYSLEPPRRVPTIYVFRRNVKNNVYPF